MTTREIARHLKERGLEEDTAAFTDVMTEKLDELFAHHQYGDDGWWVDDEQANEWARAEEEVRAYLRGAL